MKRTKTIQIELTEEQKTQIQEQTDRKISVVKLNLELAANEDHGLQNPLTHVVPLRGGGDARKRVLALSHAYIARMALRHFNDIGELGGIPTIHFAKWALIDGGARLLFLSNYDGSWETYLDDFLAHFGGEAPIPFLVGLWPLRSHQLAVRIHNEVPGMVVPESVQERLRQAGAGAPEVGLALARELLAESREKAAGVYVVAPFRQPLGVLDLLT